MKYILCIMGRTVNWRPMGGRKGNLSTTEKEENEHLAAELISAVLCFGYFLSLPKAITFPQYDNATVTSVRT